MKYTTTSQGKGRQETIQYKRHHKTRDNTTQDIIQVRFYVKAEPETRQDWIRECLMRVQLKTRHKPRDNRANKTSKDTTSSNKHAQHTSTGSFLRRMRFKEQSTKKKDRRMKRGIK